MTVKELIEELQKRPQDMFIAVYSEANDTTYKICCVSHVDKRYDFIYLIIV